MFGRRHHWTKILRSPVAIFKKDRCIICWKEDGKIQVYFKTAGFKILAVAKKLEDKSLFLRLNQISNVEDTIANDFQYYPVFWDFGQRKAKIEASNPQELQDINWVVTENEIISMVESFLQHLSDIVLNRHKICSQ